MVVGLHRHTYALIDIDAIKQNVANEVKHVGPDIDVFAVVKANAYGHGAINVAEAALEGGAAGFCVAILDEALELRQSGFSEPILIVESTLSEYAGLLAKEDIATAVIDSNWLEEVIAIFSEDTPPRPIKVHIKIDSGMNRIGFYEQDDIKRAYQLIKAHPYFFELEGVFTHFSTADSEEKEDTDYFQFQQQQYLKLRKELPAKIRYEHTSNTATSLWHGSWQSNMVRFGISLYGLNPSGESVEPPYELKPAFSLKSDILQVKQIPVGAKIGYGATYTASENEWIATIPIGYADGWIRAFSGFNVLVEGEFVPIVGRICMDQCMIRLTHLVAVGTEVTLIGKNGSEEITMEQAADYVNTINYEIPCIISERVPRLYNFNKAWEDLC